METPPHALCADGVFSLFLPFFRCPPYCSRKFVKRVHKFSVIFRAPPSAARIFRRSPFIRAPHSPVETLTRKLGCAAEKCNFPCTIDYGKNSPSSHKPNVFGKLGALAKSVVFTHAVNYSVHKICFLAAKTNFVNQYPIIISPQIAIFLFLQKNSAKIFSSP